MSETCQNYINNTDNDIHNNFTKCIINYDIKDIPEECFEEFA
jgi:hypothetical protein